MGSGEAGRRRMGLARRLTLIAIAQALVAGIRFDPSQIEQVLINLLKNAHEAGSPGVERW